MIRSSTKKLLLLTSVILLVVCFIPTTYAEPGKWPGYLFKKPGYLPISDPPGINIGHWWYPWIGPEGQYEIPADEYCFFRAGWIVSDYEIEMGFDPGPPYQYKLFINDENVVMKRWTFNEPNGEVLFPDNVIRTVHSRAWMWIVRFEPGYFESGKTYKIREVFSVQKPYQGSDIRGWRPYVNYMSGGAPDAPYTWEDWYGDVGVISDQIFWLHVY